MAWNLPFSSGLHPVACTDVLTHIGLRSSLFRMYYPTTVFKPNPDVCPLWLDSPEYATGLAQFIKLNRMAGLIRWLFGSTRVPVLWNGPLIAAQNGTSKWPVVLFSHGLGGSRTSNSYLAYEVASHGFVVASIEHRELSASMSFYLKEAQNHDERPKYEKVWLPYKPAPAATAEERKFRNEQVYERVAEMTRMMDCMESLNAGTLNNLLSNADLASFKGRIDLERAAVMGHSFGGATAIVSLAKDPRYKVGVAMDAWMFPIDESIYKSKIEKPLLFINSEAFQWKSNIAAIRKLDQDVMGIKADRKMATLVGTVHYTQSDFAFLLSSVWLSRLLGMTGRIDSLEANNINMKLVLAFTGKHLNLLCAGNVDSVIQENPDLVISGSNLEIDEQRLLGSKQSLKAEL